MDTIRNRHCLKRQFKMQVFRKKNSTGKKWAQEKKKQHSKRIKEVWAQRRLMTQKCNQC